MSDWRLAAACADMAPMFDVDYWIMDSTIKDTLAQRLIPLGRICDSCPVRRECEAWADQEVQVGNSVDWIAGGYLYRDTRGVYRKTKIGPRKCESNECPNTIDKGEARFCCIGCRMRVRDLREAS